ncbi:MAG: hypothetical protein B1H04_03435 [Planctomycetales bacterium 4484_123]|nr:MAG: hypothetical protein B1H04_03435 [Planctomycetales bacterium 4484_123]
MAAERNKRISAYEKVLQITRDMVATVNLDELLSVILTRSVELLEAERATLFLHDAEAGQFVSRIAHGTDEIRIPADEGIAGAAARSREVLNIPDAYADGRFNREVDRRTGFRTRNILAVPLLDHSGQLVGVLEVLNKRRGGFSDEDVVLAETLGAQAGVALQRARLLEHYVEKQRMEQALAIARDIQRGQLPRADPQVEGFDVAGTTWPADETGGDIYDFLDLGAGRTSLMLADATGHGIGPALVIVEARAMIRALTSHQSTAGPTDLSAVLCQVNDLLVRDLDEMRFVTCFFGLLDSADGSVRYVSAGQGPILFYDRAADEFEELPATDLPLGVLEHCQFSEQVERVLKTGDVLAVLTDGFFEATNDRDEQFGMQRVREVIRGKRDLPASRIVAELRAAVDDFTGPMPQADDLTAIVIKRK